MTLEAGGGGTSVIVSGTVPTVWFTWMPGRLKRIGPSTWPLGPDFGALVTLPPAVETVGGTAVSYTGAGRFGWFEIDPLISSPVGIWIVIAVSVTAENEGFETMISRLTTFGSAPD